MLAAIWLLHAASVLEADTPPARSSSASPAEPAPADVVEPEPVRAAPKPRGAKKLARKAG